MHVTASAVESDYRVQETNYAVGIDKSRNKQHYKKIQNPDKTQKTFQKLPVRASFFNRMMHVTDAKTCYPNMCGDWLRDVTMHSISWMNSESVMFM